MKQNVLYLLILIFSISILMYSCQQNGEWNATVEEIEGIKFFKNPIEPKFGSFDLVLEKDLEIGSEVDENYQFVSFVRIAIDNQNNIYALDYGNHRVQKFDNKGKFLLSFGREGQGPEDLNRPSRYFLNERSESAILDNSLIIKVFDSEGLGIDNIHLKNRISDFYINSMGNIFGHYGYYDEENNVKRAVLQIDSEGNIIEKYDEFTELKTSHSIKDGEMSYTFGGGPGLSIAAPV